MADFKIFEIHTIKPKEVLSVKRVRTMILNELEKQGEEAKSYFEMTTEHWNEAPEFQYERKYAGGDIHLKVGPVDDNEERGGYKKWYWLNYGTRVRHAMLSKDWQSKTLVPGSLGTNTPGAGEVLKISKKFHYPGIEARRWDQVIRKKMKNSFPRGISRAIEKGLKGK